jgi:hypothetical protein
MEGLDLEKLDISLNKNIEDHLLNIDLDSIKKMNITIINELRLPKKEALEMLLKLQNFIFLDEITDIREGAYIKWISITDNGIPDKKLKQGSFICSYEINNEGIYLNCKGFKNRYFSLYLEKNLIFQKLSDQELIILNALKYI